MVTALFQQSMDNNIVQCTLCPHRCILKHGHSGICNARRNIEGTLTSLNYGILSATSLDPIEKKPLYHFFPGKEILSIGSFGCNLKCSFCQNCNISQVEEEVYSNLPVYVPEKIVDLALQEEANIGIAYTYNEPTVFYEFMMDCAVLAKQKELKNVVVSNGFINEAPLEQLIELTDAFNIDLKSFSNRFYKKITGSALEPVISAIGRIVKSGKHLELTFLVIPGLNDAEKEFREMVNWISGECGKDIILHLSRYYPNHQLTVAPTPLETIAEFVDIAKEKLHYVYPGNTGNQLDADTLCPNCSNLLIGRKQYVSELFFPDVQGICPACNTRIYGQF